MRGCKLGIEAEIKRHLLQGRTVKTLISDGFKKSTIYKVRKGKVYKMHTCQICGKEFMNSDEFASHSGKCFLDRAEQLVSQVQVHPPFDAIVLADQISSRIISDLSPLFPQRAMALPPEPKYSFECIQLAIVCLQTGKQPAEMMSILDSVRELLQARASKNI